ncbi:MAG: tyrosine-type recombinase/integrase [Armatimonadota bacterium]
MLEYYFSDPTRLRQLRRGPLVQYLDGMAAELRRHGYQKTTGVNILGLAGQFSRFLSTCGISDASEISEELGQKFVDEELVPMGVFRGAANAIVHVLRYLRQSGIIAEVEKPHVDDPCADIIKRYITYLRDIRGLSFATCDGYTRSVRRFLAFHIERHKKLEFSALDGPEVLDYITTWANYASSRSWVHNLATNTRSFLGFLRWENLIDRDLERVVPSLRRWRLATVPSHLPWEQVREIIDGVNAASPEGMRDRAILLLLATLGLRNYDVRTMEFSHIDWRESVIRLPKTKNLRARVLPMSQELGEAIADYILNGRPHTDLPFVFIRHKAPVSAFTTSPAITGIVQRHVKRLGIPTWAGHRGSHLLRHSLASKMVNSGSSIKGVADMLGHACIDTTAIYTKVDTVHLMEVALPLPGGVK